MNLTRQQIIDAVALMRTQIDSDPQQHWLSQEASMLANIAGRLRDYPDLDFTRNEGLLRLVARRLTYPNASIYAVLHVDKYPDEALAGVGKTAKPTAIAMKRWR
jgi:hypothetical protein